MKPVLSLSLVLLVACSGSDGPPATSAAGGAGATGGSSGAGGSGNGGGRSAGGARATGGSSAALPEGGTGVPDAPFTRPPYEPKPGSCGFDQPAFCETFETGPAAESGRSGELDPLRWSGVRGGPWNPPNRADGYAVGPAIAPACRADLPRYLLPDRDAVVCDPTPQVPTRHLLITAASQNYGLTSYRIRQPFDFRGRTGTLKLDVNLTNQGLGGWPAVAIATEPAAAPSFDWEERGSGPKDGVEIEFVGGFCAQPRRMRFGLFKFKDYVQTAVKAPDGCDGPNVATQPGSLNHVEIYLTANHIEVWASDFSTDGVTYPNFQRMVDSDLDLPDARAYVNLIVRNHATMKYWLGAAGAVRFDNVGFDGPVVQESREYSAPDSLTVVDGLDGCLSDGACRFRGDVILDNPGDDTACPPDASCRFPGEGRHVGYVIPRDDETALAVRIPSVSVTGATKARLVFAASYPWFDWGGVSRPPTAITLQYRLNDGPFHDRPISTVEANAFTDFYPEFGGAGHGAGLLNQVVDVDVSELKDGDNVLELRTKGTWTGEYRAGVTGIDLVVDTGP